MSKNDSKTAIELINLIRDMISTELDKRDNTCVCQIVARNLDETFNIIVVPDERTVINRVKSISPDVLKEGDYVYVYKFQNRLNNAIIIAKVGNDNVDLRFVTTDEYTALVPPGTAGGGGGGGGGTVSWSDVTGKPDFKTVSWTANYNDLINRPTISLNIQDGAGTNAIQEKMADATVDFTGRNPNAEAIDSTLSAVINTGAAGNQSVALNKNTMALATASMTNGNKTVAKGEESHAEGYQSVTLGDGSHAEGARTTAVGIQSHSEGEDTIANGEASHSEGHNTNANNYYAHAEGEDTIASGRASHAEGEASKATALVSHAEGTNNYIGEKPQDGPSGGGETTPSQPSGYNFAAGESAHAEGFDNFVYGAGSHAEGAQNVINGTMSHAEGVKNTIGSNVDGGHVEGRENTVTEIYAHAEGYKTTASGTYSHTEGYLTTTASSYAHAEGQNTHANGYASHSQGASTYAKGTCSFTGGQSTEANANFATAIGLGLYTSVESSFVVGKYNATTANVLFGVGNGTSDSARSNAFEVYQDGHAEIGAMGSTNSSVATKKYVDDHAGGGGGTTLYKHSIHMGDFYFDAVSTKSTAFVDINDMYKNAMSYYNGKQYDPTNGMPTLILGYDAANLKLLYVDGTTITGYSDTSFTDTVSSY